MADRPKKKQSTGERNPDRKCGKAPKKHPKIPKTLTPEEKAERDRVNAERRIAVELARAKMEATVERSRRARINHIHEKAIVLNRAFDDARRRELNKPVADAIKRMVGAKS